MVVCIIAVLLVLLLVYKAISNKQETDSIWYSSPEKKKEAEKEEGNKEPGKKPEPK